MKASRTGIFSWTHQYWLSVLCSAMERFSAFSGGQEKETQKAKINGVNVIRIFANSRRRDSAVAAPG